MLKEVEAKYSWIKELLSLVLKNKYNFAGDIGTSLQDLTKEEAAVIGGAFCAILVLNMTPKAAVEDILARYPAMTELAAEFVWLRPFLNEVGKRLLSGSRLGTHARAYSGAMFSTMDMGSDVNLILVYFATKMSSYTDASIAMISTRLTMQIMLARSEVVLARPVDRRLFHHRLRETWR